MTRKILFGMCGIAMMAANAAWADGTHGVKIDLTNNIKGDVEITTFNGKDGSQAIPHKVYYVKNVGAQRTIKCHGQGTNECGVAVRPGGSSKYYYHGYISDKKTCTVSDKGGTFSGDSMPSIQKGANQANMVCQ